MGTFSASYSEVAKFLVTVHHSDRTLQLIAFDKVVHRANTIYFMMRFSGERHFEAVGIRDNHT